MYCNHYGFSEKPFDVTPDPRFLFLTPDHRESLASILYGIQERRGFITVIGEVGTGKTTLLNAAVDMMGERARVAFIFNTDVTFNEMLNMALYEWGLIKENESVSKVDAIQRLNRFAMDQMKNGFNLVLIVDEAQHLDLSVLENLRLLSNMETRRNKLIQIVLSGQPELDTKLQRHELRQLAQRISIKRYVSSLDEKCTYAYLQHRLKLVQNNGAFPLTPDAKKLIWEYTNGVPRKINILCDNALLIGYALKRKKIDEATVSEAAQDLKWHKPLDAKTLWDVSFPENAGFTWANTKPSRRSLKLKATMVTAGILILTGILFFNSNRISSAKLPHFFSNIKGIALETVHPEQAKPPVNVSQPDISVLAAAEPEIKRHNATKKHPEHETRAKHKNISNLMFSNYHLVNASSLERISQDNEAQYSKQVREFIKNDPFEIQVKDREKPYHFAAKTRSDSKEKVYQSIPVKEKIKFLKVKIKKGDTLFRIITRSFGGYDGSLMEKVLRKNPGITDPNKILAGQEIRLPTS